MTSVRSSSLSLALAASLLPVAAEAQFTDASREGEGGWAAASVGARVGYDNAQSRPVVSAVLRIPVLPSGRVELLPNGEITFLPGFRQYQLNVELVYLTGGRGGGFYVGGGAGVRRGVFGADPTVDPENEQTLSIVAGLRFGGLGRLRPEVEARWIFQDEQFRDPRVVLFGASVALW
jgi:hypothetical protein